MRILFIGDVVGSLGGIWFKEYLPKLKEKYPSAQLQLLMEKMLQVEEELRKKYIENF